ncbi:caspase domain-containing protein [Collybia nuda]|uniref:Caspase domain-containing protein n=1 Tax=Collybia nuda TaxID=64659 RepID=A0A9P5Y0X1_9AGAR|nr:caspase domain-containing protein [Collybia nuda]
MKIVRHRPGRRPEYWSQDAPQPPPKKKALLVGIQYEEDADGDEEGANVLRGPHRDVAEMRELLIECYEYAPGDIVVLIDRDEPEQMQPTRANMLREIKKLVQDAGTGDHFFFHYAGHTVQIENKNNSEEDGMDECLIPSDGENYMITDNELRRHLVDSLPIGANLVAIFDSCHSASLLDLEHFRCNRVYVPWISKGKRRSDSQWNANVRRQALGVTRTLIRPRVSTHRTSVAVSSRHVYQTKRINVSSVRSRRTSIDQLLYTSSSDYKKLSIRTKSLSFKSDIEKWYDTPESPIQRCESPASMWPCTGWCPPTSPHEANVISLAACKDDQLSWEDLDGASMTQVLVNILKNDPNPRLVDMLMSVSHELHSFYLRLHGHAREYRKNLKELNRRRAARNLPPITIHTTPPEMHNFQDPQLSSLRPLDRNAKWDP